MWDERYAEDGFAYGAEPNDFLVEVADRISPGPVLCLAEGEGRNAVFLAGRGHQVTAVDLSSVGLAKAEALAASRGVSLTTRCADLAEIELEEGAWACIVSIWAHVPPPVRRRLHAQVVRALQPGGVLVLEAYTLDQLAYGTGGPQVAPPLMTLAGLREELDGLEFVIGREVVRDIHEGKYHHGMSATVQVLAKRPGA
jgi:SAM-dependent methyltransferase